MILLSQLVDYLNTLLAIDKIKDKELVKLVFGGDNNLIEICDINLKSCNNKKINKNKLKSLLRNHILKLDSENLFYVRRSKKDFIENKKPEKYGLETFETYRINSNQNIYFKEDSTIIDIDENNKIIDMVYQCKSCVYCQASVSLLSQSVKNENLDEIKNFIASCEKIFENTKFTLEKKWNNFKELFDKKHESRKECLLLPVRTLLKAIND